MRDAQASKVAYFGGTFDPPHWGHLAIARRVLAARVADEVWFVPVFAPPHKDGGVIASFEHRKNMLELLLQGESGMQICEVEKSLGKTPSYTVDMLGELKRQYPRYEFVLLIGGDSLEQLGSWHRVEDLLQGYEILVYPRQNCDFATALRKLPGSKMKKISPLDGVFCQVSSTEARKKLEKNQSADNIIPQAVLHYIKENGLYGQK